MRQAHRERWPQWLNSIHVHIVGLAITVIAALTAISLLLLSVFSPVRPPLSIYEIARIVKGQPVLRRPGTIARHWQERAPPAPAHEAERIVSALLAARLGRPPADVRVTLNPGDRRRVGAIAREVAVYGPDQAADPLVLGPFSAATRDGQRWQVVTRRSRGVLDFWRVTGWNVLLIGSLLVLPLTLWFSARLARPIQAFAASAQRLGRVSHQVEPVRIAGPTEIRLAARSLNDMQARIVSFVRERTTLMGAIAHDLRAPLSRLQFRLVGAPADLRAAAEEDISEMKRLVDVILEFVENETRPRLREALDLSMLVEGLVDDFADMGKEVRMEDAVPITTLGDPLLLKRLFVNLVDNALKYGGSALVGIRREGGAAVVEVRDHGRGMNDEEIARAFEPFFRGEPSRNRRTGGVGLGLSIVKSAADAHGATVELSNAAGGGLIARVRLPIEPVVAGEASHGG